MTVIPLFHASRDLRNRLQGFRDRLYRVAYSWCHDPALADDLVQETLTKALQKAGQLRDPELLKGWLFKILANCCHDHHRQCREMHNIEDMDEASFVHQTTPESEYGQSQTVLRVRRAIACLPLGQRQVVTLVDLEEMSYAEVADVLGVPVGTVMSRLCRARQALKVHLLDAETARTVPGSGMRRVK